MFSYKDNVRYSDVDKNGKLPLYGVLAYFQNCINQHSFDIGKDYEAMETLGKVWVLISWKIKVVKEVKAYDKIEVGTWSHGFDRMYGYRNYIMYDEEGNRVAYADTKWVLIDINTRMPQRPTEEDLEGYVKGEAIDMPECSRRLKLSEDREKKEPVKVLKTYIDTNGHMNNTAYFRLADEYIPEEFKYNTVDAVYVKETTEGMTMVPYVHKEENGVGISFESEDGIVFTKIKFYNEEEAK